MHVNMEYMVLYVMWYIVNIFYVFTLGGLLHFALYMSTICWFTLTQDFAFIE